MKEVSFMEETIYTIDMLIQKILDGERQYDLSKILSAYEVANKMHDGQKRTSGEPYISHPLAVAFILLELGMDTDTICAAILHDVVEDTDYSIEELYRHFGNDIAALVDGVTKLKNLPINTNTKEEQQAENVRKIILAMSEDIRVIIIKLCDRLHNMRTLACRPEEKRRQTAHETMNIYAPLAHRLGIRAVKEELEDLAFQYLDPYAWTEIENLLEKSKDERDEFIQTIKGRIAQRLQQDFDPVPTIEGRVKSLYGIYKKLYIDGKNFEQIYDKYAVRIIVNTVTECYNVLGIIHDLFTPIPNRFKDYISTPKPNMYQSLHTTVIGRESIPFEVQIRTWEMHHTAELGIAAHWKYKEGIQGKDKFENRLAWIRQIIEAQQESDDVEEIVRTIKNDLAPEDVYVFTPKGDMISLPIGSTIIDFAYAIHTQVGNKMMGAKVDKKMVPFDYKIKTGEIVEIVTSNAQNHGPNRAWLNMCRTNEAKSKIRSWFKKERREENIIQGKEELEREFRRNFIRVPEEDLADFLALDMKRHNCATLDDFFASIGYGGVLLSKIIQRLKDEYLKKYVNIQSPTTPQSVEEFNEKKKAQKPRSRSSSGVMVDGIDNCVVKFSQCCNPLPGDDIIGFVTRGHGVSIHKKDCINYINQKDSEFNEGRWITVLWDNEESQAADTSTYFKASLDILALNRMNLFADISALLASIRIPLHEVMARELKNGNSLISIIVGVASVEQLSGIINRLNKIEGVISTERSGK